MILADPVGSLLADWVEGTTGAADAPYALEGIGQSAPPAVMDRAVIHGAERVTDADSFAMTGRLLREEGLLVGGSSGKAPQQRVRSSTGGVLRAAGGPARW